MQQLLRHLRPILSLLLIGIVTLGMLPTTPVHAALITSITVSTAVGDTSDASDNKCSLREALQALFSPVANCGGSLSSPLTITFDMPGTIKLLDGVLPNINNGNIITITGPVIIDGMTKSNTSDNIFIVKDTGTLILANLTLTRGARAITVDSGGSLDVAGVSFLSNTQDGSGGGAIYSSGTVNIAGALFTANTAPSGSGGAIISTGIGKLNVAGTIFTGNTAKISGGAISSTTKTTLTDTIFNGNIANGDDSDSDSWDEGGGAVFFANSDKEKPLSVTRGVFNGNLSPMGSGGALFVNINSTATVSDSALNGNLAGLPAKPRSGGAIYSTATLTVTHSTFLNNGVVGDGGAIANDRSGKLNISNSTLVANAATYDPTGSAGGKGGGIATLNSQTGFDNRPKTTLLNVTLALNASDNNQGGGLYSQVPSSSYPEVTVLGNTIISSSDDVGGNCVGGAYTSRGHNLDSGSSCGLSGTGDLNNADAKLGAPFFNGGPIPTLLTMKLKPGSAAIDTGDNAICDAEPVDSEDQRGSARPQDGNGTPPSTCDIGSYEGDPVVAGFGSDPVAPGPIPFGNATVGTSLPGNLSIFNTGDAMLTISAGSLTGTNAADFALTTSFPISIAPGDPAKTIGLTCTPSASGSRSASLILSSNAPGATSVSYTLDCTGTPVPTAGFGSTPPTPGPIDVGKVRVGESKSASLQIAEIGSTALNVSAISIGGLNPGDFSLDSTANISIANGGSAVSRTITCTPSTIGQRSATLIMQTNDPNQTSVSFALSCTGKPAPQKIFEETGTTVATTSGPYGVTLDPQGAQVYVTTDGAGAIDRYLRDDNGYPTSGVNYVDGALGGSNLAGSRMSLVSPDGKFVYTTAMIDDAINVFTRNLADGTLTYQESVKFGDTYGVLCLPAPCSLPTVKGLNGAYVMALSPDGQYMYVSGISSNSITILSRNPDTGSLKHQILGFTRPSVVQEYQDNTNLSGAYGIAISPDGKHLYATGYSSDTLVVFTRKSDGSLDTTPAKITVYKASDSGLGGLNGVFRVTVSPDGRFVYSASYDGDSVMAFQRDPASGKLTLAGTYTNGQNGLTSLDGVSSVVVSPDSRYLIVSAAFSKAVSIFARDQDTGELDQLQVISSSNIEGTRDVAVAPDGRMIFVSGYLSNKVVGFALANPVPAITSLEPASASMGSAQITLSIHGEGFAPGAIVTWGGTDLIGTQFVSSSEVTVPVPVSLLSSAGTAQVGVRNPAPGGGSSTNNVVFTIVAPNQNSVPSITTIIPGGVLAGSSSQVLSVNGAGFLANSAILWNGIERPTVYIDGSTLQATISASDMLQPGTSSVAVRNPAPGGGVSNIVSFNVAAPGENPVPAISTIMPKSTIAGSVSTEQIVTISGANFTADSQAYWAGNARPTTYVSPTELRVAISGGDLLSVGTYSISVSNPEPGGGTSNNAIFRIGAAGSNPVPSVRTSNLVFTIGGGLQITLSGEGFVSGAKVRFGGVEYTPSSVSATQIVFSIPKSAARSASLFVVNPVPGGGKSDALLVSVWQMRIPLVRR